MQVKFDQLIKVDCFVHRNHTVAVAAGSVGRALDVPGLDLHAIAFDIHCRV